MFLPFRWVAGNERGEKSYVAAILCCAARANLEGVASCSTTLLLLLLHLRPGSPPRRPPPIPPPDSTPRHLVVSSCYPPPSPPLPSSLPPPTALLLPPCQTHEPIDCRFCIICQDPNSLMHVYRSAATLPPLPVPFLYSPVTYSAVSVFFNNERNVSSTSDSFVTKNDSPRSDTRIDAAENNSRYQQGSNLKITFFIATFLLYCNFLSYLS